MTDIELIREAAVALKRLSDKAFSSGTIPIHRRDATEDVSVDLICPADRLEAQLSAIRQAVAKLKAGCSTSDFFAALYELDTFNPAPVVNQQLTTAPVQGENNG